MTCDFTSFSTVMQSYQDDIWKVESGITISEASALPTELPGPLMVLLYHKYLLLYIYDINSILYI